jgi:hypothetical protein
VVGFFCFGVGSAAKLSIILYKKLQMIASVYNGRNTALSSKSSVLNGLDLRFAVNFAKAIE